MPQSSASSPTTGTEVDSDTKARMAKKLLSLKKKKNTKACSQKLVKPRFLKSTPNTFCWHRSSSPSLRWMSTGWSSLWTAGRTARTTPCSWPRMRTSGGGLSLQKVQSQQVKDNFMIYNDFLLFFSNKSNFKNVLLLILWRLAVACHACRVFLAGPSKPNAVKNLMCIGVRSKMDAKVLKFNANFKHPYLRCFLSFLRSVKA